MSLPCSDCGGGSMHGPEYCECEEEEMPAKKPNPKSSKKVKEKFDTPWSLIIHAQIMLSKQDIKLLEKMDEDEAKEFFSARLGLHYLSDETEVTYFVDHDPEDESESYMEPYVNPRDENDEQDDAAIDGLIKKFLSKISLSNGKETIRAFRRAVEACI